MSAILGIIQLLLKLALRFFDWQSSRKPKNPVENKVTTIRNKFHKEQNAFRKYLKQQKYQKAASKLRDVSRDIDILRRLLSEKTPNSSNK